LSVKVSAFDAAVEGNHPHDRTAPELDHYASTDRGLAPAKIRKPDTARSAAIRVRCREVACPGRAAAGADELCGCAGIPSRRCNSASGRPLENIRMAIFSPRPPTYVLLRPPVESGRSP